MIRKNIPREEWPSFCDGFSRQHEGWLVNLEVTPAEESLPGLATPIELGHDQPLQGITAELLEELGEDRITVIVGPNPDQHLVHEILEPTALTLEQEQDGADAGLLIESARSGRTAIRFRVPAMPEMVDEM